MMYRLHDSLPREWQQKFGVMMANLRRHFPLRNDYGPHCTYTVYAWRDDATQPFGDSFGYSGAGVYGDKVILEIPKSEFDSNPPSWHRYTVIPHEYYHVYQLSRSGGALCKWMLEGTAACFESLYIKEYEGVDYFGEQSYVTSEVLTSPSAFEDYNTPETNYSNSVFMVLVLHKELVESGETVESAFSKIFREYWAADLRADWKTRFYEVFGFSVEDFYTRLSSYTTNLQSVLPASFPRISEYSHG